MSTAAKLLAFLALIAGLQVATAEVVLDIYGTAVTRLNEIGSGERARQEQIRQVACEAFPDDCPEPVPAWVPVGAP